MGNGMRALKILTIAMGVLILAGTAVIIGVIFHRATSPASSAPVDLALDQPAGSRIVSIAATQDRLALQLQGGGADRVVLVDPRTGAVTGQIALSR
ncbi:MAG TPA: DUF6476 family protein [Acetobacteraceae bacterium]|nr:DUF6476 family protein [Acetobacteraceae bacterium]